MQPPQYEPITTLGKLGIIRGFHFLDPSGGLGKQGPQQQPSIGSHGPDTLGAATDLGVDSELLGFRV